MALKENTERGAFETETFHRLLIEAVRYWLIEKFLRDKTLPVSETRYVYADGPVSLHWGNAPGQYDPVLMPMRGKRIRVTVSVEDF